MTRSKLLLATTIVLAFAATAVPAAQAQKIQVGIGHQSMCTDTYTAGLVIKEMKLLEKHLPKTGKYKDAQYEITWADYSSGGPITNQMLANKLSIGVMGDYPLIVNGAKFQPPTACEVSTSPALATTSKARAMPSSSPSRRTSIRSRT